MKHKITESLFGKPVMRVTLYIVFVLMSLLSQPAFALGLSGPYGYAYAKGPCAKGAVNARTDMERCEWVDKNAPVQYGPGQVYSSASKLRSMSGYKNAYVPYTGKYKFITYICYTSAVEYCTMAKQVQIMPSVKEVELSSGRSIAAQSPDFGGVTGAFTAANASAPCWALEDEYGVMWQTREGDGRQCRDAHVLPETPAACYINYGEDLNVDLGTLERAKISRMQTRPTPVPSKKPFQSIVPAMPA